MLPAMSTIGHADQPVSKCMKLECVQALSDIRNKRRRRWTHTGRCSCTTRPCLELAAVVAQLGLNVRELGVLLIQGRPVSRAQRLATRHLYTDLPQSPVEASVPWVMLQETFVISEPAYLP
jgi:hypothetical protein